MSFKPIPKFRSFYLLLFIMAPSVFAMPATQETATAVLKASMLDQTVQHYQTGRVAQRYSQSILKGIPATDLVEDKTYYEQKIQQLFLEQMQSADFKNYYIQKMRQPYLRFYQEEELIHLLHIYQHPLAQAYFQQNLQAIHDQQDQSYRHEQSAKDQALEQQIIALLRSLSPQ